MSDSPDSSGPSTGRRLSGRLGRAAVVLIAPPLVTLAVFFTGLAVNGIRNTEYYELRFLVALLLCGPLAPAVGFAAAVEASFHLLWGQRFDRVLAVAVIAVNLVTVCFVWVQAFRHFIGVGWG